ncbi:hypothetical protein BDR26DRAFT_868050 [Obelidium mucronatum]|nr:hypothetical protein BDR26DRAFT_868050 [Obelidium mucronatum]
MTAQYTTTTATQQLCQLLSTQTSTNGRSSAYNQLEEQQKQAQMAILASQMMAHMTLKASTLLNNPSATTTVAPMTPTSPTTTSLSMFQQASPPPSPAYQIGSIAGAVAGTTTTRKEIGTKPIISTKQFQQQKHHQHSSSAAFNNKPTTATTRRFAPYSGNNRRSSLPAINCNNLNLTRNTPSSPLTPSISSTLPLLPTCGGQAAATTATTTTTTTVTKIKTISTSESLQIQKIVMTALATLRLPSHCIIMALYFVHKLLTLNLSSGALTTSDTLPAAAAAASATSDHDDYMSTPVALFLVGLMLADSSLCDAPVSVSTWSWILVHSCPPFSPMSDKMKKSEFYARNVRKWALNALQFDVSVGVEVYGEWVNGVKGFMEGVEQMKRRERR